MGQTKELSAMQMRFADAFVELGSALGAATKAGYSTPARASWELIRNPRIIAEIKTRQAKLRESKDFTLAKLFDWTVSMATADPRKLFKPGQWIPLKPNEIIDDKLAVLIEGVKTIFEKRNKDGTVTITTWVKLANRSPYFQQLQNLLGVPKSVDITVNKEQKIPLSVIDAITTRLDDRRARERESLQTIDVVAAPVPTKK